MKNIGIIFGGKSTEHNISVVSGTSVISNINKTKYNITPIYIDPKGDWYLYTKDVNEITILEVGEQPKELEKIENPFKLLKSLDVVFPVLHGLYGEDGTIQGMLELLGVPYVGCKVLGSCLCMDKAYTKIILEKAQIPQAKYLYVKKEANNFIYVDKALNEHNLDINEICNKIQVELGLPVFVKPSNSGSSVGITKAHNLEELEKSIEYASKYDSKILIEENINAREIECAVIGNSDVKTSCVGEIIQQEEFYDFDSKYNNPTSKTVIPAVIDEKIAKEIKELAIKAYKAVDAKGLARVDFFVDKNTNKIYLNEINTMPGFTKISMYPQLWEKCGKPYSELLDELIINCLV